MEKKTIEEVIRETFDYYQNNPRGMNLEGLTSSRCLYKTDKGYKCAVGRCLTDKAIDYLAETDALGASFNSVTTMPLPPNVVLFKEEYSDIPDSVWTRLQCYHDRHDNFHDRNEHDISKVNSVGLRDINEVLSTYCPGAKPITNE
jgi:hypothetical protein